MKKSVTYFKIFEYAAYFLNSWNN